MGQAVMAIDTRVATLLRVLNVAIWMQGSNAKAVRKVHAESELA